MLIMLVKAFHHEGKNVNVYAIHKLTLRRICNLTKIDCYCENCRSERLRISFTCIDCKHEEVYEAND